MNKNKKQQEILFTIDCIKDHKYNFDYCFKKLIKQVDELQQENQQLKEQMINLYKEFKLNNVSTATEYQMICMQDELHKKEVANLQDKLQQRDEVIKKAIKYLKSHAVYDEEYECHFADMLEQDECYELLEILTEYKGGNNDSR